MIASRYNDSDWAFYTDAGDDPLEVAHRDRQWTPTDPCPTCGGTGQITRPHPDDHAYMPRRPITRDCPNCTDKETTP